MPSSSPDSWGAAMKQGKLIFPSSKRTASAAKAKKVVDTVKSSPTPPLDPPVGHIVPEAEIYRGDATQKFSFDSPAARKQEQSESRPVLNIKDPRWRKLFVEAKAKRSGLPLIHGDREDDVGQILRAFDLNYDYGPCIGVSRLERWERAHVLGLNPPSEIYEILSTQQGMEKYSDCVFHGEV